MKHQSQYKPLIFFCEGKKRIIKDIFFKTESDLEAHYQNCLIIINQQETGGYYAKVRNNQGILIVDSYFDTHNFHFDLQKAVENVFEEMTW